MHLLKQALVGLVSILAVLVGSLLLWGLAEPYFLDEEPQTALLPQLPSEWEGQRFALMADWQLGMWMDNERTVRRAVARLAEARPAFVLIAGDFVYHSASGSQEEVQQAVRLLAPLLEAEVPVFAVLGNHDYSMTGPDGEADEALAQRLTAALQEAGVSVLENESVALSPAGTPEDTSAAENTSALHIVGVGPSWPERAAPRQALAQVPPGAPRLVLMHNPEAFAKFPAGTAPVALAGHTHGGQVRLPQLPEWSWLTYVKSDPVHTDGWATEDYGHGSNRLYVNRGIGFSVLPLRINAMPEVTFFTLRSR